MDTLDEELPRRPRRKLVTPAGVAAVAVALAGMAAGRVISRVLDAPAAFYPVWFYFWVETLAAAALLAVN